MARTDPQVNLRIPAELKALIDEAAGIAGRSMNAEVVARLESSFQTGRSGSQSVEFEVADYASKHGLSEAEALTALVRLGLSPSAPQLIYVAVHPGASLQDMQKAMKIIKPVADADADFVSDVVRVPRKK